MDQKKLGREKVNLRLFLLMAAAWLTLLGLILMGYSLQWTGFREQTLWDWLQLLLAATVTARLPIVDRISVGNNISANKSQRKSVRKRRPCKRTSTT